LLPTPSAHAPQSFSCSLFGDLQLCYACHDIAPAEPHYPSPADDSSKKTEEPVLISRRA
jgi:hypothetical protein